MATVNKHSLREELASLKGQFESLCAEGVVSRFVSWNPQGNLPVCSVDGLPGMTKQSEKRWEPVPSPFS